MADSSSDESDRMSAEQESIVFPPLLQALSDDDSTDDEDDEMKAILGAMKRFVAEKEAEKLEQKQQEEADINDKKEGSSQSQNDASESESQGSESSLEDGVASPDNDSRISDSDEGEQASSYDCQNIEDGVKEREELDSDNQNDEKDDNDHSAEDLHLADSSSREEESDVESPKDNDNDEQEKSQESQQTPSSGDQDADSHSTVDDADGHSTVDDADASQQSSDSSPDDDDGASTSSKMTRSRSSSYSESEESQLPSSDSESRHSAASPSGSKQSRSSSNSELDEEDLELIQENLGTTAAKKRRIRIRSLSSSSSEDDLHLAQERSTNDGQGDISSSGESDEESNGAHDDIDKFIVHDGDKQTDAKEHIYSDAQRLAVDIFGVDIESFGKLELEESSSESEEAETKNDDIEHDNKGTSEGNERAKPITEIFEPYELEKAFYTDIDHEIRCTDIPERMQTRKVPITSVPENSDELDWEAEWIFMHEFIQPTNSVQVDHTYKDCGWWKQQTQVKDQIKSVLQLFRQEKLEVPFIAQYRKEHILPELDVNALWRIFHKDEEWCQLQQRKTNFSRLLKKMQVYQTDSLLQTGDKLPEGVPPIGNEEFLRLDSAETIQEYQDVYNHFMLYHGRQVAGCHAFHRKRDESRNVIKRPRMTESSNSSDSKEGRLNKSACSDNESKDMDVEVVDDVRGEKKKDIHEQRYLKQASKNYLYNKYLNKKLLPLTKMYGLTPQQFGENLKACYLNNEVEQVSESVDDVVAKYVVPGAFSKEDVIQGTQYLVARQIAAEPSVRRAVREVFYERAMLSVRPTEAGLVEIGEVHPIYHLKYLKNKPIRSLKNDDFLKLMNAKDDRLIILDFAELIWDKYKTRPFVDEAVDLFKYDGFSAHINQWNELRAAAVRMALETMLYKDLRRELIDVLRREALDGIKTACRLKLRKWIQWAPFGGGPILGLSYGLENSEAAFAVLISEQGDVGGHWRLNNLVYYGRAENPVQNQINKNKRKEDFETLKKVIVDEGVIAVAIACHNKKALGIHMALKCITADITAKKSLSFILMDTNLANVYANTDQARTDLFQFPPVLKQAVSIARRLQNPLVEFGQLFNHSKEILCLQFHPLQNLLAEEDLVNALSLEMVNMVNSVGVDIKDFIDHPHTANLIQFVSGLGPRKGAALLKIVRSWTQPFLENRQHLVIRCHMGPKVFINCCGFINITDRVEDSDSCAEILDSSRIHCESYDLARKLSTAALKLNNIGVSSSSPVEQIVWQPELLDDLDLTSFAEDLHYDGHGDKSITVQDIKNELKNMYRDPRKKFEDPTPSEVFAMVTKETPETFYVGKMVMAMVTGFKYKRPAQSVYMEAVPEPKNSDGMWGCPICGCHIFQEIQEAFNHIESPVDCPGMCIGVRVSLENSIHGFIALRDLSDSQIVHHGLCVGDRIHGRIVKIFPDDYLVWLSSKVSTLKSEDHLRQWKDPWFNHDECYKDAVEYYKKFMEKNGPTFLKRGIFHPNFQNVSREEAEGYLASQANGEAVIRPSPKGDRHLTLTWKVSAGIFKHIDIREESNGKYVVEGEDFEDLDEIIVRHLIPMARSVEEIMASKYFESEGEMAVNEKLKKHNQVDKSRIHFYVSTSKDVPGNFVLSFNFMNKIIHEHIKVTPDGLRCRNMIHETVLKLIGWCKGQLKKQTLRRPPISALGSAN